MKILFLHPHLNIMGGATRLLLRLAKFVSEKGNYVEIWSDNVDLSSTFPEASHLTVRDIGIFSRNHTNLLGKVCVHASSLFSYVSLPSKVKEFDLINSHNFPSNLATLSHHCRDIPIIWHCNEPSILLYPTEMLKGNQSGFVYAYRLLYCRLIGQPIMSLDKLAVKKINKITVLSRFIADQVKVIYNRNAHVLRIGVDLERFHPDLKSEKIREKHEIYDNPLILTVVNFVKRLDLVLNALQLVKNEIRNVTLLIVGAGDDSLLQRTIKKYRLVKHVRIAKNVPDDVLPLYYNACDMFVFPQPQWSWSIAAIEAMACGKPIVVPKDCGVSEVIQNNKNGIKVNVLNAKDFASSMINLLKDEKLRESIGVSARKYVELNLDEKRFFESYHKLLKEEAEKSKIRT